VHYMLSLFFQINPIYVEEVLMDTCALGFSGVLFTLITIHSQTSAAPYQA